jgi:hypothetical protein
VDAFDTEAEKTENFWASLGLWHAGHSGSADPSTSFSKLLLQSSHTYSNIGMKFRSLFAVGAIPEA